MLAALGGAALGVLSGIAAEGIIRSYDSHREPEESEYIDACVERAVRATSEQRDIDAADIEDAVETACSVGDVDVRAQEAAVADIAADLAETANMPADEASDIVEWFLSDLERQLARKPSIGLPLITDCLDAIAAGQTDTHDQLAALDQELSTLHSELKDIIETHGQDLAALDEWTDGALEQTVPPGLDTFLDRDARTELVDTLEDGRSAVVAGPAGVGKSTLVQSVVDAWDGQQFLLRADRLSATGASDVAFELGLTAPLSTVLEAVADSDAPVLLGIDQLDSVARTGRARTLCNQLAQCAAKDNVVVVGATRGWALEEATPVSELRDEHGFEPVELTPFEPEQTRAALTEIGVSEPGEELVELTRRALEFSLVAELVAGSDIPQSAAHPDAIGGIQTRVQLWKRYVEELFEVRLPDDIGPTVGTIQNQAAELAEASLREQDSVLTLGRELSPAVEALVQADVLRSVPTTRSYYEFRHEQVRAYFYADELAYAGKQLTDIPAEIPDGATGEVIAWLLTMYDHEDNRDAVETLLTQTFDSDRIYLQGVFVAEVADRSPRAISTTTLTLFSEQVHGDSLLSGWFYESIDDRWLEPLADIDAFDPLGEDQLDYFYAIAQTTSMERIGAVLGAAQPTLDISRHQYVSALAGIPQPHKQAGTDQYLGLLADHPGWQGRKLFDLIEGLIADGTFDQALALLEYALMPTDEDREPRYFQSEQDIRAHLDEYAATYLDETPERFVEILENALVADFEIRHEVDPTTARDSEWSLQPFSGPTDAISIESTDQLPPDPKRIRAYLVAQLRDALTELWNQTTADGVRSRLERYLRGHPPFVGLAIHALTAAPGRAPDLVVQVLTTSAYYERAGGESELKDLLRASAPVLASAEQAELLEELDQMPDRVFETYADTDAFLVSALEPVQDELEGALATAVEQRATEHTATGDTSEGDSHDGDPTDTESELATGHTLVDHPDQEQFVKICNQWWPPENHRTLVPWHTTDPPEALRWVIDQTESDPTLVVDALPKLETPHPALRATVLRALGDVAASLAPANQRQLATTAVETLEETTDTRVGVAAVEALEALLDVDAVADDTLETGLRTALEHPDAGPKWPETSLRKTLQHSLSYPAFDVAIRMRALDSLITVQAWTDRTTADLKTLLDRAVDGTYPWTGVVLGARVGHLIDRESSFDAEPLSRAFPTERPTTPTEAPVSLGAARGVLLPSQEEILHRYEQLTPRQRQRLGASLETGSAVLDRLATRFVDDISDRLAAHAVGLVLTAEQRAGAPPEPVVALYDALPNSSETRYTARVGPDIVAKGLRKAVVDGPDRTDWAPAFELWEWRLDQEEFTPREAQQFLRLATDLIERGHRASYDLLAASVPVVADEFLGWKTVEKYLVEHVTVEPREALELYAVLCEQNSPNAKETSSQRAHTILEPALTAGDAEMAARAHEVGELVAETTGEQSILALLDRHRAGRERSGDDL